ncbi:hypothetical protein ACWGIU_02890 [Streptomyces sp. NPDC054840]|uniref:hypothetical protein n=1 Tax=Streptomyces sp. CG 926 TaxID=1882405 RepID=UPI003F8F6270
MTSPAPSRLRPEAAEPELRTDTERVDVVPDTERDSRPDTERREEEEREDRAEAEDRAEPWEPCEPIDPRDPPEPREPRAALVIPVGGDTSSSAPAAIEPIGASPHVSQ